MKAVAGEESNGKGAAPGGCLLSALCCWFRCCCDSWSYRRRRHDRCCCLLLLLLLLRFMLLLSHRNLTCGTSFCIFSRALKGPGPLLTSALPACSRASMLFSLAARGKFGGRRPFRLRLYPHATNNATP